MGAFFMGLRPGKPDGEMKRGPEGPRVWITHWAVAPKRSLVDPRAEVTGKAGQIQSPLTQMQSPDVEGLSNFPW